MIAFEIQARSRSSDEREERMPGLEGTWVAINPPNPTVEAQAARLYATQHPGPGQTVLTAPKLWFVLRSQGSNVTGILHDDKSIFTCELNGTLSSDKLALTWQTVFHWLGIHESGTAQLKIAWDRSALDGSCVSSNIAVAWHLTRGGVQPIAQPAPARVANPAPPGLPFALPPQRQTFQHTPYVPYPERLTDALSNAPHDPPLMARLVAQAGHDPELKQHMIARGYMPPDPPNGGS
jgi:hypothetical protein